MMWGGCRYSREGLSRWPATRQQLPANGSAPRADSRTAPHHRAEGLAGFLGEYQEPVVCGQVEVGIQAQAILVGEQADSLDVAQARLRVALLQHAIEFLVAIRGVSAGITKRPVNAQHD